MDIRATELNFGLLEGNLTITLSILNTVPTTSKPPYPNEANIGLENLLWRCKRSIISPDSLASPS